jgi:hypothetical protein
LPASAENFIGFLQMAHCRAEAGRSNRVRTSPVWVPQELLWPMSAEICVLGNQESSRQPDAPDLQKGPFPEPGRSARIL